MGFSFFHRSRENGLILIGTYLSSTGQTFDYEEPIFDFYLLYWAWGDLDYGQTYQDYVPEATKYNIEELVVKKAIKWLENH